MNKVLKVSLATLVMGLASTALARDQIKIVGSSTVYPFSTIVGEEFGANKFKTPIVESTGTGGGFQLFCQGLGPKSPDIVNASRAIKDSEREECRKNGVNGIVEVKFGNDGIAFVNSISGPKLNLSLQQLWQAMSQKGKKPKTWSQISPSLPTEPIEILIPPPTSGTRDAWNELVMEKGCPPEIKNSTPKECALMREDGVVIDAGENDSLIVNKLQSNPKLFGILGFSYLEENLDKIQSAKIGDIEISMETVQSYTYPVSRPLYFYVKKEHVGVIPGIKEYVEEFLSHKAAGQEGYLSDVGLVPLSKDSLTDVRKNAENLKK